MSRRPIIKIIVLAVFILAVVVGFRVFGLDGYLDPEALKRSIGSFGPWGPAVYILLYSIAPSLMLPGLPITIVGGVLFGPFWGVVYVAIGATVGAAIAFLVARFMGRSWVEGAIKGGARSAGGSGRLARLDEEVRVRGWKIVAFTRLIPLFPYNVLNYAFGLTRISFVHYILATFVFMFPGIIAYVVFSSSILDLLGGRVSKGFIIGLLLIVIVSLIPVLYKRYKKAA
jgi:uncharacterized membrane protein YdjX (TVP38/TMEM64 family)